MIKHQSNFMYLISDEGVLKRKVVDFSDILVYYENLIHSLLKMDFLHLF